MRFPRTTAIRVRPVNYWASRSPGSWSMADPGFLETLNALTKQTDPGSSMWTPEVFFCVYKYKETWRFENSNSRFGPEGQGSSLLPSPYTMRKGVSVGGVAHQWGWHVIGGWHISGMGWHIHGGFDFGPCLVDGIEGLRTQLFPGYTWGGRGKLKVWSSLIHGLLQYYFSPFSAKE